MATATLTGGVITDTSRTLGIEGDGQLAASSVAIWDATTNLDPNPNATTDVATWTGVFATRTRDTTVTKFGGTSFKLVCSTAGNFWMAQTTLTGSPVTKQAYARSVWVYGTPELVGKTGQLQMNEVGGAVATTFFALSTFVFVAGWQRVACGGTPAQSDRTSITTLLTVVGGSVGNTLYAGGFQFEPGRTLATPYAASSRAAARAQIPTNGLSSRQGWIAAAAGIAWGTVAPASATIVRWADDATHSIELVLERGFAKLRRSSPDGTAEAMAVCIPNGGETAVIVGQWTPTGVSVSVDGGPFRAGLDAILSDEFNRADTVSGLGVADTGQTWALTGSGTGHIVSNRYGETAPNDGGATSGNVYAYLNNVGAPVRMSARIAWHARGAGLGVGPTLICSIHPNAALTDMIHFPLNPTTWTIHTRIGNEAIFTRLGTGPLSGIATDGTVYDVEMVIDAPRNRIYLGLPDGTNALVEGVHVAEYWGPHLIYETGGKATDVEPRFDSVKAEIASTDTEATGGSVPTITATLADIGSKGDGTGLLNGELLWVAMGRGAVNDAALSALAAVATDPAPTDLSRRAQTIQVWPAVDTTIQTIRRRRRVDGPND